MAIFWIIEESNHIGVLMAGKQGIKKIQVEGDSKVIIDAYKWWNGITLETMDAID